MFFDGKADKAHDVGKHYDTAKRGFNEEEHKKDKGKRFKDIYSYQANLARTFHRKYREFSAGFHPVSLFAAEDLQRECVELPEENYLSFVAADKADKKMKNGKTKLEILHELAWLDHRRWCSFMRVKGFRISDGLRAKGISEYYDKILPEHAGGDHKFVSLKLHPCLVECSKIGINAKFDEYGFQIPDTEFKVPEGCKELPVYDLLDRLSLDRYSLAPGSDDFKRWDYPEYELSEEETEKYKKKRSERNS